MSSRPRRGRLLAGLLAGLAATATATGPSVATARTVTPQQSVTVFLKAPDAAGVAALPPAAAGHVGSRRRLLRLLPSAAEHAQAARALRDAGFMVTAQTGWSITATAPAARVAQTFGARPAVTGHASARAVRAATGSLPVVPASLAGSVRAVFPTSGGPKAYHSSAARLLDGGDFRKAYTSPALTQTAPPYTGADPDGSLTLATLQLSNWHAGDLASYASMDGLRLRRGQYQRVTVDGGPGSDTSGDDEVALDQESMLSTDPHADQRAYFAPNTAAGYNDVFSQVLDDVLQDRYAAGGGDPRIAALSTSWGGCESQTGNDAIATLNPILSLLSAAGVTVFASSGDDGIYDCGVIAPQVPRTGATVDYPASSPRVVGVGGTNLQANGARQPNDGTNWKESAWSCSDPTSCETAAGTGGSGGGVSKVFAEPAYQRNAIGSSTYTGVGRRLVPDIALDGDPDTGFDIYTSDHSVCGSRVCSAGGTSLSSPVAAALLANTLAHYGRTTGIGDIHPALYDAFAAAPGSFRDIISGSNGLDAQRGADPSVNATAGYDTVTGLGAPLWPALAPYLLDMTAAPTVTARLRLTSPHSRTTPRAVTAAWSLGPTARGTGIAAVHVSVTRVGHPTPVVSVSDAPAVGSTAFTAARGATYQLVVQGTDLAGNSSRVVTRRLAVPVDDASFSFHRSWTRHAGRHDIAGSHAATSAAGAFARIRATGTSYSVAVRTGPTLGKLGVYRGTTRLATVDLYTRSVGHRTVPVLQTAARGGHTLTFRYLGRKNRHSRGRGIDLDGLVVTSG